MISGYSGLIKCSGITYTIESWSIKKEMENTFKVGDYVKLGESFTSYSLKHDFIYTISFSGVNQMVQVENNSNVYYKKYFEKVEPKFKINQTVLFDGNLYKVVRTFVNDGKLFYFCTDERLVSINVPEEYLKPSQGVFKYNIGDVVIDNIGHAYKIQLNYSNYGKNYYIVSDFSANFSELFFSENDIKLLSEPEPINLPVKSDKDEYYYWFFSAQEINGSESANPENIFHHVMETINYFHSEGYIVISYKFINKNDSPGILVKFNKV